MDHCRTCTSDMDLVIIIFLSGVQGIVVTTRSRCVQLAASRIKIANTFEDRVCLSAR